VAAPALDQSTLGAAFDAAEPPSPHGEPSRPAQDHISLDSVFGDESVRRQGAPADASPSPAPAGGGSFSFDDFFQGGAVPPPPPATPGAAPAEPSSEPDGPRTPGRSSGRMPHPPEDEIEADQFQQWLKKLKS
jgi:hypothetical protein